MIFFYRLSSKLYIFPFLLLGNMWYYLLYWKSSWYKSMGIKIIDEKTWLKPNFFKLFWRLLFSMRWIMISVILYRQFIQKFFDDHELWPLQTDIDIINWLRVFCMIIIVCNIYTFFNKNRQSFGERITWTLTVLDWEKVKNATKKEVID